MNEILLVLRNVFIEAWVHVFICLPAMIIGMIFGAVGATSHNLTVGLGLIGISMATAFLFCRYAMRASDAWYNVLSVFVALLGSVSIFLIYY